MHVMQQNQANQMLRIERKIKLLSTCAQRAEVPDVLLVKDVREREREAPPPSSSQFGYSIIDLFEPT